MSELMVVSLKQCCTDDGGGGGDGKHCDHGNHGDVDVYFDVDDKVGRMLLVLMDWTPTANHEWQQPV